MTRFKGIAQGNYGCTGKRDSKSISDGIYIWQGKLSVCFKADIYMCMCMYRDIGHHNGLVQLCLHGWDSG